MKKFVILIALICVFSFVSCRNIDREPLQEIKGQKIISESTSPDNKFIIKAYKNNGGATVDWAVLCTLTDNSNNKTKNIYWRYHEKNANIKWIDNDTVEINGITLNIPEDTYDWRNQ